MTATSMLLQTLIVGACVLFAGVYMLGRYAPKLVAVPRAWLAQQLDRSGHARIAAWMRPPLKAGGGCHTSGDDDGGSCGSCGSCGSSSADKQQAKDEQPLIFHRH